MKRRVAITGLGVCSSLGMNVNSFWSNLINGTSGIAALSDLYTFLPSRIAGSIPDDLLNYHKQRVHNYLSEHFNTPDWSSLSRAGVLAIIAVSEAFKQVTWKSNPGDRAGVYFGLSIGGVDEFLNTSAGINAQRYSAVGPRTLIRTMGNIPAGVISQIWGLRGPCMSANTACATGLHCIGEAYRMIKYGEADLVVAGATESSLNPWTLAVFSRIRALCTKYNDNPTEASRPFDNMRDGFVIAEGAGAVVLQAWPPSSEFVVNSFENCPTPLAELIGFGRSADAYSLVSPDLTGNGALRSMSMALDDAKIKLNHVGHINCHATSTPLGDIIELIAISQLFQKHFDQSFVAACHPVMINSIKGHLGHCLAAAGAIETIYTALSVGKGQVAGNINLQNPITADQLANQFNNSKALPIELINNCLDLLQTFTKLPTTSQAYGTCSQNQKPRLAMTNSFGFGGTNGTLVLSEWID